MNDFWHRRICNKSEINGEDWRYIRIDTTAQETLYCAERIVTINPSDTFW
jgi:hypothetical protein